MNETNLFHDLMRQEKLAMKEKKADKIEKEFKPKNAQKVTDLETEATNAVATLKQSLLDNDYKQAQQAYTDAQTALNDKETQIAKAAADTKAAYDQMVANNKAVQDAQADPGGPAGRGDVAAGDALQRGRVIHGRI